MKKSLILLLTLTALTGCATNKTFANRVSCTVDGSSVIISSMYGPFGLTTKVDGDDAAAILALGCAVKK